MRNRGITVGRRRLTIASLGVGFLLFPFASEAADPSSWFDSLDTASIPAKNPAGVLLVAIARCAQRLFAVGEHGIIIYSDDNAKTWRQAQVPVNVTLTCIGFANSRLGWAAGHFGVVLVTTDGGQTWNLQLNGLEANQLTLAAAHQADEQGSNVPGAYFATKRANFFVKEGPDKPFLTLLVLSPQEVIVFGAYRMTMLTTDGGKTWVDWSLHIYDRLSHNIYGATIAGQTLYIVAENGLVFKSLDNGNTFLPLPAPAAVTLFGIIGTSDNSLLVFGVAGSGFRSTDGGETWSPLILATQDDLTAGRILDSGAILLASESGQIFISRDYGVTFHAVVGIPSMTIYDIQEAADHDIVIAGASGITLLSADCLST